MNSMVKHPSAILLALFGLMIWSGTSRAECGPGPVVTSNSKGILQQVLGATTNATFLPTQALAITSGTSGCSNSGVVDADRELKRFTEWNLPRIQVDAARGEGAYLVALADLFGCVPSLGVAFSSRTQNHFDQVFPQESPNAEAVVARLRAVLSGEPSLAEGCSRLG